MSHDVKEMFKQLFCRLSGLLEKKKQPVLLHSIDSHLQADLAGLRRVPHPGPRLREARAPPARRRAEGHAEEDGHALVRIRCVPALELADARDLQFILNYA